VRFITGTWNASENILLNGEIAATTAGAITLSDASNNTLDQEYVLDLKKWRWYKIDRTTGKRLQCGITVLDTQGNQYTYGLLDTGYMMRLENGTDFDGNDITCTFQVGDQVLISQDLLSETRIHRASLVAVSKNTDSSVSLTHYLDGASSGTSYAMSVADVSHRYANDIVDIYSNPAVFHSFKLTATTDQETKGFEPLYFAVYYGKERDRTQ